MKICSKCKEDKPYDDFYKNKSKKDGRASYCKLCATKDVRIWVLKNKDKRKAIYKKYTESNKEIIIEKAKKYYKNHSEEYLARARKYRKNYPERVSANNVVKRATSVGDLTPQPCFICGGTAEAHHPTYHYPLAVTWLCREHHSEIHNG